MNNSLSQEIRYRAMWCHLSGLTWLFIKPIGLLLLYGFTLLHLGDSVFGNMLILWKVADLILPFLIPSAVWLFNRRLHPFVDLAGKATVNFLLTITVQIASLMLLGIFMILTTCGVFPKSILNGNIYILLVTFAVIVVIPILLILLTHIATTIYAAFRAYKGEVYTYPMTIKFFK
jgi:uncharacterized Tic20 family protein